MAENKFLVSVLQFKCLDNQQAFRKSQKSEVAPYECAITVQAAKVRPNGIRVSTSASVEPAVGFEPTTC